MKFAPIGLYLMAALSVCSSDVYAADPPAPYGPVPEPRQLIWQHDEFYGFAHFTVNTFTGKQWGDGNEPESVFNPTDFNPDQIAKTMKDAGMKGLILTAKHHDGFCLWPSKYTEHSVKNSPWKNGKGDVVRDLAAACKRQGIKFGVYLSPWDRSRADYGKPGYLVYYQNQLRELMTNYGSIFELWLDGAQGGTGWYGGAQDTRNVDATKYYQWPDAWVSIVRQLQPGCNVHSDGGPDNRWGGNENGSLPETCWATFPKGRPFASQDYGENSRGDRKGDAWIPPESDTSIEANWFHVENNPDIKTPLQLLDIYFATVGHGGNLLLNVPPDKRGQICDAEVQVLQDFRKLRDAIFAKDLATGARITASNVRGEDLQFAGENLIGHDPEKYWSTDDKETHPNVVLEWSQPVTFNVISLREFLPLGQRISSFALDSWQGGQWVQFAAGTSIGNRRLMRGASVTTQKVRLRITDAPVCPALSEFALYLGPDTTPWR
jgi:alpha-L-fucosidase